ncbi:GAF domain-containing protein [Candidatus Obscuribacterales bacterium]|nr:GAF domain-containing protein [Candidatus Obscuribacterales bacterium]
MTSSADFGEFPYRPSPLVQKLFGVRDLKRILETTVRELGDTFNADACQVMLSNPLDPNVTSICEFRASPDSIDSEACVTVPLVLQGRTFGSVSVSRDTQLTPDELNALRVLLGELGDIIRLAQINDIVQRDTFRETFLVEIGNVMAYSMGIGDALFLVVNILGKALQASRCLFICTDEQQAGWKCYEFWQQDKVASCQEYYWPATDSPLVAQVLLSRTPLKVFEGRMNSYVSPVQEELQFINVKSLLGVPLRSEKGTHGCVILQQCDYRRAWTRSETDMVQNVADKVAEALLKLPAEKLAREPIMQLHQRIVTANPQDQGQSDVQLRRALKGALGQQAIPSARKTSQQQIPAAAQTPPPPSPPPPPPPPPPAPPPPAVTMPDPMVASVEGGVPMGFAPAEPVPPPMQHQPAMPQPPEMQPPALQPAAEAQAPAPAAETASGVWASPAVAIDYTQSPEIPTPQAPSGSLDVTATMPVTPLESLAPTPDAGPSPTIKPITRTGRTDTALQKPSDDMLSSGRQQRMSVEIDLGAAPPKAEDPYADLDFGDEPPAPPAVPAEPTGPSVSPLADAIVAQAMPIEPVMPPPVAPAEAPLAAAVAESTTVPSGTAEPVAEAGGWGNLDAIPTPKSGGAATTSGVAPSWGNLDDIPTPSSAGGGLGGGLKGSMMSKAKATSAASPLMSSFKKSRGTEAVNSPPSEAAAAPAAPIDEAAAKKKLDQIMSSSTNETSDYIFQTPGLDARLLGRIDGWVAQIEQKDRYKNGHARQVAQYAVAIAEELGMKPPEVATIRQSALVHDLGKLGIHQQILQKADDSLEDEQFVLKMGHAVAGAQLLESFPDLKHLAPIVMAHHEEYDGEGFPQGLKGDEIPVAARIVCVANSYHELVADKVYGAGMNPTEAQQQMVEGAGSQFDPTLVEALIQAIQSGKVPPTC